MKQAAGQMKSANDYAFDEDGEPGNSNRTPGKSISELIPESWPPVFGYRKKGPSGVELAAGQMQSANDYGFDEDGEPGNSKMKPGNSN